MEDGGPFCGFVLVMIILTYGSGRNCDRRDRAGSWLVAVVWTVDCGLWTVDTALATPRRR